MSGATQALWGSYMFVTGKTITFASTWGQYNFLLYAVTKKGCKINLRLVRWGILTKHLLSSAHSTEEPLRASRVAPSPGSGLEMALHQPARFTASSEGCGGLVDIFSICKTLSFVKDPSHPSHGHLWLSNIHNRWTDINREWTLPHTTQTHHVLVHLYIYTHLPWIVHSDWHFALL